MRGIAFFAVAAPMAPTLGAPPSNKRCGFGNGIEHIVYTQLGNVHLRRDNPNVTSDSSLIATVPSSMLPDRLPTPYLVGSKAYSLPDRYRAKPAIVASERRPGLV
jgi:hypothetical protein